VDERGDGAEGGAGHAEAGEGRAVIVGKGKQKDAGAEQCAQRSQSKIDRYGKNARDQEEPDASQKRGRG
jgi:hypothetical protein